MVEKLKNVLETLLKETYPEIKNVVVLKNEYAENIYTVLVNIDYSDFIKMNHQDIEKDIHNISRYINCRVESIQFF